MKTTKRKVAKRPPAPAVPTPLLPAVPLAPISATLSPQASALVRRYCAITKHFEADAVEGAVFGCVDRALDAYDGPAGGDEAFNWLMEDVLRGMNDDARHPLFRVGGGVTSHVSLEATRLLQKYHDDTDADVRDIVSAAVLYALKMTFDLRNAVDGDYRRSEPWQYFEEEVTAARQRRQEQEAEQQQRIDATAAFYARKEVAA